MSKTNRVVTYATPLNLKNIKAVATKEGVSQSQIVNRALTEFFKKEKPAKLVSG